ncbi:hypothetical protein B0J11DRAFT_569091 [Dendryphion nanum]|uniref:Uncharacterized protein n=1 Tax=Dendryphion nanum TaxID=256645 RepID=A0A9P9DNL0_9PLEO|nr:hypothetical protein B0J11DRAFT_569091 [Dendryphion nanum]
MKLRSTVEKNILSMFCRRHSTIRRTAMIFVIFLTAPPVGRQGEAHHQPSKRLTLITLVDSSTCHSSPQTTPITNLIRRRSARPKISTPVAHEKKTIDKRAMTSHVFQSTRALSQYDSAASNQTENPQVYKAKTVELIREVAELRRTITSLKTMVTNKDTELSKRKGDVLKLRAELKGYRKDKLQEEEKKKNKIWNQVGEERSRKELRNVEVNAQLAVSYFKEQLQKAEARAEALEAELRGYRKDKMQEEEKKQKKIQTQVGEDKSRRELESVEVNTRLAVSCFEERLRKAEAQIEALEAELRGRTT